MLKTARFFSDEQLSTARQQTDPIADAVVAELVAQNGKEGLRAFTKFLADFDSFTIDGQPAFVQAFFNENAILPTWADRALMTKGAAFFRQNRTTIALVLGCYSLPYCYAGADGAQVLWLTERIRKDTFKRLEETGLFVFGVMQNGDWENGKNTVRILKVRLMHAAARYFTYSSGQWNDNWGRAINQEDMAGTNLAFSYIVVDGLRKLGVTSTDADEEAYLHYWCVVGFVLGVQECFLPHNLREAYRLGRAIADRSFRPSEAGQGLAAALRQVLEQNMPSPALQNVATGQMRFLLGDDIADLLALPKVSIEKRLIKATAVLPFFQKLINQAEPPSAALRKYWR